MFIQLLKVLEPKGTCKGPILMIRGSSRSASVILNLITLSHPKPRVSHLDLSNAIRYESDRRDTMAAAGEAFECLCCSSVY
jgi:hypothetical protein